MVRRVFPTGPKPASRLGRCGIALRNSTSNPARAATDARNPATRPSPACGWRGGRNAGFTLGSAISSARSFAVFVILLFNLNPALEPQRHGGPESEKQK